MSKWLGPIITASTTLKKKRKVWNSLNYWRNREAILEKKRVQHKERRARESKTRG